MCYCSHIRWIMFLDGCASWREREWEINGDIVVAKILRSRLGPRHAGRGGD